MKEGGGELPSVHVSVVYGIATSLQMKRRTNHAGSKHTSPRIQGCDTRPFPRERVGSGHGD